MDAERFDHLSRRLARSSSRRAALGLAATLGLSPLLAGAGKKIKNRCGRGCGICRQCVRHGRTRRCVRLENDIGCAGGTGACVNGTCCLRATCASLGVTCGTVPDGCGRELSCGTCGTGPTPACNSGTCATCAATCAASCFSCFHQPDGSTACGNPSASSCATICSTSADCPPDLPLCVSASTNLATNVTTLASCAPPGKGICAAINPC